MNNRADSRGDRVALYVFECFQLDERPDLDIHANLNFECLFIEVHCTKFGRKGVSVVYHPPNISLDYVQFRIR